MRCWPVAKWTGAVGMARWLQGCGRQGISAGIWRMDRVGAPAGVMGGSLIFCLRAGTDRQLWGVQGEGRV
jgi:hypothetical protein